MAVVAVVVVVMVAMVIVAVIAAMAMIMVMAEVMMMGIMIGSGITSRADSRRSTMVIASNGAVGGEALIIRMETFPCHRSGNGQWGLGKAQLRARRRSYFSKAQPLCCALA
jgi:hypothetical protein